MVNHAWIEISKSNILRNAFNIYRKARPTVGLLPVVKADAYGLGSVAIVSILDKEFVWGFAVATIDEAIQLRCNGVKRPILVLRPALRADLEYCQEFTLIPVIDDPSLLKGVEQPFHLEIDTGMARSGVRWDDSRCIEKFNKYRPRGVFTHFHSSEESMSTITEQLNRFSDALFHLSPRPDFVYCANSAAAFYDLPFCDLVRPGIYIYGGCSLHHAESPLSVVSLKARVLSVRSIKRGDSVSYNRSWKADADCDVATLAIGYADGVPRNLSKDAYVLIRGVRCPIVGMVTMDMLMVDLSKVGVEVQRGDIATLIGQDDIGNTVSLTKFAEWGNTIPYEILTRLGPRLARIYI